MLYWEQLDLERLENVYKIVRDGEPRPRQLGFTTMFLHLLLHEVKHGDPHNTYLFVSPTRFSAKDASHRFTQIIEQLYGRYHHHVVSRIGPYCVELSNGQRFCFINALAFTDHSADAFRGYSFNRIFVDVSATDVHQGFDDVMDKVRAILATFLTTDGDII